MSLPGFECNVGLLTNVSEISGDAVRDESLWPFARLGKQLSHYEKAMLARQKKMH